ncbi:LL-diaminopimelate aminotransferase [Anaerolinea thermophila]|uniref:Aminotransferase n=1 Tax=Anaerolinea thermophila (strain DSM 14523 / JCM 11388 / NBRC 100420 / UNI-1) TaxID=926569 RepID=E8N5K7_ANATU|nr:LL-diaminopimelate aminotransferase [Anaerolinea thermophila]BAJ63721.1 aminotransferase [Anaerolinea thermophila UNI-1]
MTGLKPMMFQPADRIASFKPYFFAQLNQKINELRTKNVDVIRLDMGSPDLPPASFIIEALVASARQDDTHGYTQMGGSLAFKKAVAHYYQTRFGVNLDPQTEVLALIGSKEGLFNLAQVILNPGDVSLVPDPAYPVYASASIIAGAEVHYLPLLQENQFLPDLERVPEDVLAKAKLIWINYPNNPTGAIASLKFYEKLVEFAFKYHILIANDAPYMDICFNGYQAPSILQIPEAKQVAVEFNSLSKTYNMAGWRVGMAVGNAQVIKYLHTYKSQADSAHFQPVIDGAIAALTGDQSWLEERNAIYLQRRDLIISTLQGLGFEVTPPPAAIYVWAKLPSPYKDSVEFCNQLLEETGVSTTPGVVYGKYGEGYLRISLGTPTDRIAEAMKRLQDWLGKR